MAAPARGGTAARFETRAILGVAVAHCVHDAYPGFVGVLLPILIARFDLSLAVAGLLASVTTLASLTQPLWATRSIAASRVAGSWRRWSRAPSSSRCWHWRRRPPRRSDCCCWAA